MNTISVPPKSSTTTTMEEDQSENRDSCYYPGCRKDANCNCEICLASINATLDLMPSSFQKSSLTKLSSSRPSVKSTPISFDASILSTPRSSSCQIRSSPALKSSARLNVSQKMEKAKKKPDFWGNFFRLALGLSLILFIDFGLSWAVSGVLRPVLSPDIVKGVGEKSWVVQDLNGSLRFLQKELQGIVNGKVSNCSYANSVWEVSQDGLLLNSRCTLYKSATEEVSIWGWPLQTAGLLTTGFSCRSLTILSGRVTEWSDGQIGYLIRKANTSWVQKKLGASAVQLDPNTWVLEYQRSSILDDLRLYSAAIEFMKYRISRMAGRVKQSFWLYSAFENNNQYSVFTENYGIKFPT